jgi:hypothetical protein
MKRLWIGVCLMAVVAVAMAGGGPRAVRKQAEASMRVTGMIHIAADGAVSGHTLDKSDQLPPGVIKLIADNVSKWRFETTEKPDPSAVLRAKMSLLLTAKKLDDDSYTLRIRAAHFDDELELPGERIKAIDMGPPRYPGNAVRSNVKGTAYVVLRVGKQGTVEDAFVEQVNLTVIGSEHEMTKARDMLGRSALNAAKRWTFKVPTAGKEASAEYWTVRAPVSYCISETRGNACDSKYGEWSAYIPGPRQRAPWITESPDANFSPDTLASNQVYDMSRRGPRLLTPLEQG